MVGAVLAEETFNPLLPQVNELVYGAIAFIVLFVVLSRLAMPAIRTTLRAREERIRGDLERAASAKAQAEQILTDYRRQLADARREAGRIIEESRQAAEELRRELLTRTESEAADLRARAQADLEATVTQVRAGLERQMADLAITLAEKVVERSLDREAQRELIDRYIEELQAMPAGARGS